MSRQFVTAASKPAAPMQLNQSDMTALLSLLDRVTKEIDAIKADVKAVKSDAHAVNRAIVEQRYGNKVVETAGESHSVMAQLAAAPTTNAAAVDQWTGYRMPGAEDEDLRGYVPGAH